MLSVLNIVLETRDKNIEKKKREIKFQRKVIDKE